MAAFKAGTGASATVYGPPRENARHMDGSSEAAGPKCDNRGRPKEGLGGVRTPQSQGNRPRPRVCGQQGLIS